MEIKQQLKLSQQLVMTPQLQQAIKLLQLSRLELIDEIRKELDGNPVLAAAALDVVSGFAAAPLGFFLRQDGIVVELLADFVLQLEARQLQQSDCLLQLGSHDQLLGQA